MATKYSVLSCGIGIPYGHSFVKECRNKIKTTSKHKFRYVRLVGVKMSGDGSGYVFKRQLFDRDLDRYREFVIDLRTGVIIREVDEPLSEHWGRGSAKMPNKKTPHKEGVAS